MSSRRRVAWLAAAVVVLVAALVFAMRGRRVNVPPDAGPGENSRPVGTSGTGGRAGSRAVPVVTATAAASDVPVFLNGLGTATPYRTVTVRSRVDGQLMSVAFQEGQHVRQGQLLAEIDPRPYQVQLSQAEGQLAKDEAALKNAQIDLQRYRALLEQDAIPRQQLDTQVATVNQLQGTLEADRGQVSSAKLNLTYARITAPLTGRIGLRQVDPGNIVHASDQNGIAVITQVQPMTVVFTLPADALPAVMAGMKQRGRLRVEAWDRDLKTKLAEGTLETIDNQIDTTTGTVKLKGIFSNADEALFPNQFVNARLLVDTLRGAVTVPPAAVQRGPQGTFVWVVEATRAGTEAGAPGEGGTKAGGPGEGGTKAGGPGEGGTEAGGPGEGGTEAGGPGEAGTAEMRACEIRLTEGNQAVVASGLKAGEVVAVEGVDRLQQGSRVVAGGGERR